MNALAAVISEWQPGLLVIGLPTHSDGAAHRQTDFTRRFAERLRRRFALPLAFADERHSTQQARAVVKKGGEGGDVDDTAAAIILQNYLDNLPAEQAEKLEKTENMADGASENGAAGC